MIVDVHSHVWDGAIHFTREYRQQLARFRGGVEPPPPRFENYRATCPSETKTIVFGAKARRIGQWVDDQFVADYVAQNPDKLIGFLCLDPTQDAWERELRHGHLELGLRGIKMLPMHAGFRLSEKRLIPLWKYASEHKLPILLHTGTTFVASAPLKLTLPRLIEPVAIRFPELRFILAHLGHPYTAECMAVIRKQPHVYADISSFNRRPFHFYQTLMLAQEYGVWDKLLLGSDFPSATVNETIAAIRGLNGMLEGTKLPRLDETQIEKMIHRNSLALLGLE